MVRRGVPRKSRTAHRVQLLVGRRSTCLAPVRGPSRSGGPARPGDFWV